MVVDMEKLVNASEPFCFDLDGTVIKTDCLIEALLKILHHQPLLLFKLPFWLVKGRIYFKMQVFSLVKIDYTVLPQNDAVIELLRRRREKGLSNFLITGTPGFVAKPFGEYLEYFDDVIGSSEKINLVGDKKAAFLVEQFGEKGFSYIGNSKIDCSIWDKSLRVIVVDPFPWVLKKVRKRYLDPVLLSKRNSLLRSMILSMRPHQWLKNILVFVPLILSRNTGDINLLLSALAMFLCFSLVSSSLYILNDLLDIEADRRHPENYRRPLAAGNFPISPAVILMPIVLSIGLFFGYVISPDFMMILSLYLILSSSYSFWLKSIALVDILALASLYTIRIFAGAESFSVEISAWLATFSGFIFLSLSLLKRCSELRILQKQGQISNMRRGYCVEDLQMLENLGVASGFISILVFALYLHSPAVTLYYPNPHLLWFICPILYYWISRMWLKAHKGEIPSDPLFFTFKDKVSYYLLFSIAILWVVAGLPDIPI